MAFLLPPFSCSTFHGHPHYQADPPQSPTPPLPTTNPATRACRHSLPITLLSTFSMWPSSHVFDLFLFLFLAVPPLCSPAGRLRPGDAAILRLTPDSATCCRRPRGEDKDGLGLKQPSNEAQMKCEWPNHSMGPLCIRAGQTHGVSPADRKKSNDQNLQGIFHKVLQTFLRVALDLLH